MTDCYEMSDKHGERSFMEKGRKKIQLYPRLRGNTGRRNSDKPIGGLH